MLQVVFLLQNQELKAWKLTPKRRVNYRSRKKAAFTAHLANFYSAASTESNHNDAQLGSVARAGGKGHAQLVMTGELSGCKGAGMTPPVASAPRCGDRVLRTRIGCGWWCWGWICGWWSGGLEYKAANHRGAWCCHCKPLNPVQAPSLVPSQSVQNLDHSHGDDSVVDRTRALRLSGWARGQSWIHLRQRITLVWLAARSLVCDLKESSSYIQVLGNTAVAAEE